MAFTGTMTELGEETSTSGDLRVVESFYTNEDGKEFAPKVRVMTTGEKSRPVKASTRAQLRDILAALERMASDAPQAKATTTTKRRESKKSAKDAVAERAASKKGGA